MREEEGDDLPSDGPEIAVAANAGDPLECGGGWDGVGCVGVEGWGGRDAGCWVVGWCACGCGVEDGVEAAGFGRGGKGSGVGEHVLCCGDDGVGAWSGDFDPVGEVKTAGDEVGDGLFGVLRAEGWEEGVEAGEVAGDGDGVDAGIDGARKGGLWAPAGAAE